MKLLKLLTMTMIILLLILVVFSALASAEQRFNALDEGDPSFAEYQRNLCISKDEERLKLNNDLNTLDSINDIGSMTIERRREWLFNYVVTILLAEKANDRYKANCQ